MALRPVRSPVVMTRDRATASVVSRLLAGRSGERRPSSADINWIGECPGRPVRSSCREEDDMTSFARLRAVDSRAWSTATWLAPLTTQVILALSLIISWLLGKKFPGSAALLQFLGGSATVCLVCSIVAIGLASSATPRAQGGALSIVGGFTVVFVGGLLFGFWILGW